MLRKMRWTLVASVLVAMPFMTACIALPGAGKAPVAVADETALIVWDKDTGTEHFVRTATFTHADGPIGFLVPTPTPPKLRSLPGLSFDDGFGAMSELKAEIAPRIVTKKRPVYRLSEGWDFEWQGKVASKGLRQIGLGSIMYAGDADDVFVLGQGKVGGYDTAVLRADDPKALLRWLKAHGFESDARLEGWLRPYTEKGWAITAFRFAPKSPTFTSEPVCLSFKTDRPFYPYREPEATNAPASRSLRVFLVAPDRRAGRLEAGAWPTAAEYAGPIPNRVIPTLSGALDLPDSAFRGRWLTSFLDKRPVRPDSDLFFDRDPDAKPVEPPPVIRFEDEPVYVPKGLAATVVGIPLLGLVGLGVRRKRRN